MLDPSSRVLCLPVTHGRRFGFSRSRHVRAGVDHQRGRESDAGSGVEAGSAGAAPRPPGGCPARRADVEHRHRSVHGGNRPPPTAWRRGGCPPGPPPRQPACRPTTSPAEWRVPGSGRAPARGAPARRAPAGRPQVGRASPPPGRSANPASAERISASGPGPPATSDDDGDTTGPVGVAAVSADIVAHRAGSAGRWGSSASFADGTNDPDTLAGERRSRGRPHSRGSSRRAARPATHPAPEAADGLIGRHPIAARPTAPAVFRRKPPGHRGTHCPNAARHLPSPLLRPKGLVAKTAAASLS